MTEPVDQVHIMKSLMSIDEVDEVILIADVVRAQLWFKAMFGYRSGDPDFVDTGTAVLLTVAEAFHDRGFTPDMVQDFYDSLKEQADD